jgi:hypothetical protein
MVAMMKKPWESVYSAIVCILASIEIDHWFDSLLLLSQTYKIDICCFSAKHTTLMSKSKDWLA